MITVLARLFAGLMMLALVAAGGLYYVVQQFRAPGPLAEERIVQIERGLGLRTIAERLERDGVVADARVFVAGALLLRGERGLQAGEYAFPPGFSAEEAMRLLQSGQTVAHAITIPEGRTSAEIVALLMADDRLTGDVAELPAEGSLLPETYRINRGDSRQQVLDRMGAAMQAAVAELWERRADGLPFETPQQAVILASIVEKETGVGAERPLVASVFVNRLRRGMPLQSDPTVIYAITQGREPLGRELFRSDWTFSSPYNTYQNTGLPPGPIANPGRAAIAAALDPADSPYFYFVADGSGGHAFARTLDEHNRNVAAWRRHRQQQGN